MSVSDRLRLLKGAVSLRRAPDVAIAWGRVVVDGVGSFPVADTGLEITIASPETTRSARMVLETEQPMFSDFDDGIHEDTLVWDVGGEVGVYACVGGKAGAAEVVSFEPRPRLVEKIRTNMVLNDVRGRVEQVAFGEPDAELTEWLQKFAPGAQMDDADSYAAAHGYPDVVKVDIEGGELAFLRGFEQTLSENPPRLLLIEIHPEGEHSQEGIGLKDEEMAKLRGRLNDAGYTVEEIAHRDGQPFLKAEQ